MRESNVLRAAWLALGGIATLFRVNTGKAWVGSGGPPTRVANDCVLLPNARPIALGFSDPAGKPVEGTPDLIGWTSVEITPEWVGRRVAVFTAIEIKASSGGNKRASQKHFISRLIDAGGISGFANSAENAKAIVLDYLVRKFDRK